MTQPNVIVVLTDQLRASALGCYGNADVQTPTIDSLADEGFRFERAFTPHPLCTPARGAIQTGRLKYEHRATRNSSPMDTHPTQPTLGRTFRDAGYRTGYVGKWHLDGQTGDGLRIVNDVDDPGFIPPGPRRAGYDFWRGFNTGHDHHSGHPQFERDGESYRERSNEWQPTVQTDIANEFIRRNREDPFLLFLSWGPPHPPFEAPGDYADQYDPDEIAVPPNVPDELVPETRENLAEYYGMIEAIDDDFETLLDTLDEEGVADDTVVVFTSDHGETLGAHGQAQGKNNPYEESVHVPLIVRYPNSVDAGTESDALVSLVDLFPTLAGFCDLQIPDCVRGHDLSEHIHGTAPPPDEPIYLAQGWKAVRTEQYTLWADDELQPQELYDNDADPYQQNNLVEEAPPQLLGSLLGRLVEQAYRFGDTDLAGESLRLGSAWGPDLDEEIWSHFDIDYDRYVRR